MAVEILQTFIKELRGYGDKLEAVLPDGLATILEEKDAMFARMVKMEECAMERISLQTGDWWRCIYR